MTSPKPLKKISYHQDPIYSAATQMSSLAQLRGQFAIVLEQQKHLKMTLQMKNKQNTKRRKKKPPNPNQTQNQPSAEQSEDTAPGVLRQLVEN